MALSVGSHSNDRPAKPFSESLLFLLSPDTADTDYRSERSSYPQCQDGGRVSALYWMFQVPRSRRRVSIRFRLPGGKRLLRSN